MMDFHSHIDLYPNPIEVIREIEERNIFILSVTTTPSAFEKTALLSSRTNLIETGIGLHPQLVHQRVNEARQIEKWIRQTDFVGEVGLDGGLEYKNSWNDQLAVFNHALKLSSENGGRILSIHSRRAAKDVLNVLEEYDRNTPVLHWFSGNKTELKRAVDLGCWFSIGPPMINGSKGYDLIKIMPKNRILLETDGPFTQFKNIPYMPWDAEEHCVPKLSEIWGCSQIETKEILKSNKMNILSLRHVLAD